MLAQVSSQVDGLSSGFCDIKVDIKEVVLGFNNFRISTATYGDRLHDLEDKAKRTDTQRIADVELARVKAEGLVSEHNKDKKESRNRWIGIIGGAVVGIITTILLTKLGFK
jgi:tetrahydromethanopterin S-methyltransferase subunit G